MLSISLKCIQDQIERVSKPKQTFFQAVEYQDAKGK